MELSQDQCVENNIEKIENSFGGKEKVKESNVEEQPIAPVGVSDAKVEVKPPEEVPIYATVVFDRSPTNILTQSDSTFLEQIVFREEHLKQNISRLEFGTQHGSQKFGANDFKHTIELKIFVKAFKLWETPRSYLS